MTDLLFGAADMYSWEQIRPWAKSIRASGFTGEVVLLVYRGDVDGIAAACAPLDITVITTEHDSRGQRINHNDRARDTQSHQMRFFHLWQWLDDSAVRDFRYVIATDVRDVIFQCNPSAWLSKTLDTHHYQLVAPSEGLCYKHEPWGADNMRNGFGPAVYERVKDQCIYNVGTIAGTAPAMRDLALLVYSLGESRYIPNDQSSFNLLVGSLPVYRAPMFTGWACQCGTMLDPFKFDQFKPHLLEAQPTVTCDAEVLTANGDLFYLVHQWDRVPELAAAIPLRYA